MAKVLEELYELYPCRSKQLEELFNLYNDKNIPFPHCVYISGGPSTGKTSITSTLLQKLNVNYVYVNLFECYTSKILFETLLNKISITVNNPNIEISYTKCDNMMDFLCNLHLYSDHIDLNRLVIILDKAEQLRKMDFNLLPAFLRFPELSSYGISFILISEIAFQKYYTKLNILEPFKIYFTQYNKDQLLEIMSCDYRDARNSVMEKINLEDCNLNEEFYRSYLNVFLSVFYRACRDLSELKYMAKLNFIKYCEPLINNEKSTNDSIGLWRNVAPILKSSLEVLYLRISSIEDDKRENDHSNVLNMEKQFIFSKEKLAQSLELPFYAKYLLIAAYLASYNPAKEDKRLFMKYHGKKRKTMKDVKAKSKTTEELNTQLGPKAFTFDRLLAIFYAILDEKVNLNNNLLVQVSSLVELQLLTSLSDNYNLDGQKYKCNVDFDFIQIISKMVCFNIRKYLVDFNHI